MPVVSAVRVFAAPGFAAGTVVGGFSVEGLVGVRHVSTICNSKCH